MSNDEYALKLEATEQSRAKLANRLSELEIERDSMAARTQESEAKLVDLAGEVWEDFPLIFSAHCYPKFETHTFFHLCLEHQIANTQ